MNIDINIIILEETLMVTMQRPQKTDYLFTWNGKNYKTYREFCIEAGFNTPQQIERFKRLMKTHKRNVDAVLYHMYNEKEFSDIYENRTSVTLEQLKKACEMYDIQDIETLNNLVDKLGSLKKAVIYYYKNIKKKDISITQTIDKPSNPERDKLEKKRRLLGDNPKIPSDALAIFYMRYRYRLSKEGTRIALANKIPYYFINNVTDKISDVTINTLLKYGMNEPEYLKIAEELDGCDFRGKDYDKALNLLGRAVISVSMEARGVYDMTKSFAQAAEYLLFILYVKYKSSGR